MMDNRCPKCGCEGVEPKDNNLEELNWSFKGLLKPFINKKLMICNSCGINLIARKYFINYVILAVFLPAFIFISALTFDGYFKTFLPFFVVLTGVSLSRMIVRYLSGRSDRAAYRVFANNESDVYVFGYVLGVTFYAVSVCITFLLIYEFINFFMALSSN